MKLSIIIPVYNNYNFTRSALTDLGQLKGDYEVIVVNNGSEDDTNDLLNHFHFQSAIQFFPEFKFINNSENLGFAKACNQGFEISKGEYVLFLNNDIRVRKDRENWVETLINASSDDLFVGPTAGILDANLNFISETNTINNDSYNYYMSGWCLCAKKELFKSLVVKSNQFEGPFSEEFGKAYFEDTDLSFRAKEAGVGFKIVNVPVVHFGKMTSRKENLTELYLGAKNKFINKWKK